MFNIKPVRPVDYLVIGHITQDLTSSGSTIGGTAAYAARTANALGYRVGVVSAFAENIESDLLDGIEIYNIGATKSSTFSNINTISGRIQTVHHVAPKIMYHHIPEIWRNTPVVHLGPVLQEIDYDIFRNFKNSQLYVTPQGWFRNWDENGLVSFAEWPEANFILNQCRAAVLSIEDINYNKIYMKQLTQAISTLIFTQGQDGAVVYHEGSKTQINAEHFQEIDTTGAGDIFAASFFMHFSQNNNPIDSAKFATKIASESITREGLAGAPSKNDLFQNLT